MRKVISWLLLPVVLLPAIAARASQDVREFVQQTVNNELAKDEADHSHWLYFECDDKKEHTIKQWVAETSNGNLKRVVQMDGETVSPNEQRHRMETYLADSGVQTKQRKGEEQDDKEATEMLRLLPKAFLWTNEGEQGRSTVLHFRPDPNFRPPDMEARVFSAMEGEMLVDTQEHRIASLKGKLIQDVKIFGGLLGSLDAGGTFDVERRQTGEHVWQITETHVHIQGRALLFHTISEQEDDVKSDFKPLPTNVTMQQAKTDLIAARQ